MIISNLLRFDDVEPKATSVRLTAVHTTV